MGIESFPKKVESVAGENSDFFLEVSKGNIEGHSIVFYQAVNEGVGTSGTEQTFWNVQSDINYFSVATQLYASSTSGSDTTVTAIVVGLDSNYDEVTRTVTLNGQNQVAISGTMIRIKRMVITGSTAPVGDVYLAETDTLTAGVPDTTSKIQMRMTAGSNVADNGTVTVPNGFTYYLNSIVVRTGKSQEGRIKIRFRADGGLFLDVIDFEVFEIQNQIDATYSRLVEKTDIDAKLIPGITGVRGVLAMKFIAVANS